MSQQPRSLFSTSLAFLRGTDPEYRERRPAAIIRLLVMVSFYYSIGAALISYWPAWRSTYQSYFRGLGNAAFEQFLIWPRASAHFLDLNSPDLIKNIRAKAPPLTLPASFPVPHRDREMDTLMLLKNVNPASLGLGQFRTSSRLIGYWPIVTVLALVLATPWVWRRKIWMLLGSLLMVHLFVVFRLAISLLQGGFVDPDKSFRLFDLSPWWFGKLKQFDSVINDNPTINFIAPVFIWLIVVISLELWPSVLQTISDNFRLPRSRHEERRRARDSAQDFKRPKVQLQSRETKQ